MRFLNYAVRLSAVFALVCVGLFTLELRQAAKALTASEQATTVSIQEVHSTVQDVHQRLVEKGGLLDIAKKTMLHIDRTSGEIAITSRQQRTYWDTMGKESVSTLGHLNTTIQTLDTAIAQVGTDIHGTTVSVHGVLTETQSTVASLNRLVSDPDITRAIREMANSSQNIDKMTASGASIIKTVDGKVTELAHPTKAQKAFGYVMNALRGSYYLSWLFK